MREGFLFRLRIPGSFVLLVLRGRCQHRAENLIGLCRIELFDTLRKCDAGGHNVVDEQDVLSLDLLLVDERKCPGEVFLPLSKREAVLLFCPLDLLQGRDTGDGKDAGELFC